MINGRKSGAASKQAIGSSNINQRKNENLALLNEIMNIQR